MESTTRGQNPTQVTSEEINKLEHRCSLVTAHLLVCTLASSPSVICRRIRCEIRSVVVSCRVLWHHIWLGMNSHRDIRIRECGCDGEICKVPCLRFFFSFEGIIYYFAPMASLAAVVRWAVWQQQLSDEDARLGYNKIRATLKSADHIWLFQFEVLTAMKCIFIAGSEPAATILRTRRKSHKRKSSSEGFAEASG